MTTYRTLFAFAIYTLATLLHSTSSAKENLDRSEEAVLERVSNEVKYLASDELAGRDVGTPGIDAAAEYIRSEFKKMEIASGVEDGSYYQPFDITGQKDVIEEETALVLTGPDGTKHELKLGDQYQPQLTGSDGSVEGELVFVGYGISADEHDFDEYSDVDVTDKIVIALRREPQQDDPESVFDGLENSNYARIATKLGFAGAKGAKALILVNDWYTTEKEEGDVLATPDLFGSRGNAVPFAHMKQSVFEKILKASPVTLESGEKLDTIKAISDHIDEKLQPLSQPLANWKGSYQLKSDTSKLVGNNVIGVIEGEGPHADETIVIGGHYDHLGMGLFGSRTPGRVEVHNGADDNATGTVAVVELAR
ncbi:MAG: M28 family peptidase, partial [Planctomycetota bacterium]|nr:M28 family peptidase [Planctomycetota bacterium]